MNIHLYTSKALRAAACAICVLSAAFVPSD